MWFYSRVDGGAVAVDLLVAHTGARWRIPMKVKKVKSPIDYHVRCESVVFHVNDLPFRFIRYGVQAHDIEDMKFRDITNNFSDLSIGGRRTAIENERRYAKHFFTKGLGRHDEGLQGGGDAVRGARSQEPRESIRRYEGSEITANGDSRCDRDGGQYDGSEECLTCECEDQIALTQHTLDDADHTERFEKGE
jgi:hypothetical protein